MARKKKDCRMPIGTKIAIVLVFVATILTLAQLVFDKCFDIDLGLTFFGQEMF
ncbi:MAG: hypothetical protein IKK05_04025 [Alistipes sp.]|nr:hypothetical protein [Alistipes sp.]